MTEGLCADFWPASKGWWRVGERQGGNGHCAVIRGEERVEGSRPGAAIVAAAALLQGLLLAGHLRGEDLHDGCIVQRWMLSYSLLFDLHSWI